MKTPLVVLTLLFASGGESGYLVFAKLADCKQERETQLANGS